MKKCLRFLKRMLNKMFGTLSDELFWRFRHFFDSKWSLSYISPDSLNHPHRKLLIEKISIYAPFNTVLEIGCASGPNLYLLAKKFPDTMMYGQDVSHAAIYAGQKWLETQGVKNTILAVGKAGNLKKFQDKSMDVIFTDAILIYIAPRKIESLLQEMLRIARKAIVLFEWHHNGKHSLYADHWVHNYQSLLEKFVPAESIKITKIPPEIWDGDWAKYGHIIEVKLD